MELQSQQGKNQYLEVKQKEIELSKVVYRINLLLPYPLNDFQILDWGKCINEFIPTMNLETLKVIIDMFVTGQMVYDKNIGVQNIFKGYIYLIDQAISPLVQKEREDFYNFFDLKGEQKEAYEKNKTEKERLIQLKAPFVKSPSTKHTAVIL